MLDLERFDKISLLERSEWVLSRQLDQTAGKMVADQVADLGVKMFLGKGVASIRTDERNNVTGVVFEDGEEISCSTLCFAIGVRPGTTWLWPRASSVLPEVA